MAGIFIDEVMKSKNNNYIPTKKILIVGESGSGKTTLACNLIYYYIKPFTHVVFVTPSHEDISLNVFRELCEKSGIAFFIKDDKTFLSVPEMPGGGVWVIDDYYTSTGRNQAIETLLKELVNRGRHKEKHVIYCAQLASRLPSEIKSNNTDLFISKAVAEDEKNYERLGVPTPHKEELDNIKDEDDMEKKWYKYKTRRLYEVKEKTPINRHQIIQKLKSKIPYKMRKPGVVAGKRNIVSDNGSKFSTEMLKISEENGNKVAGQELKKTKQSLSEIFGILTN